MIAKWLAGALSLYLVSFFMEGISITGLTGALWASAVLGIMNIIIKPIISFFALPFTILTLGLFTFVINGIVLLITSSFSTSLHVSGLGSAIIGALLLSIINTIILKVIDNKE